ncbi:MAG: adenosine deaminase, partial [Lachnospiraceae bacterium]|nr:adenosine deaminase [Lachnospiraceae bacterium]
IVDLYMEGETLSYVLRTPNHATGNLITNLARLCGLSLSFDDDGLKIVRGQIPCYIDDKNRAVYILRLGDTKVANIYPDGTIERKASIPAIAKTLMSQTKSYNLGTCQTLVKTYIPRDYKFRTDLHTHMNANLDPDILIALGIHHQIRYPLYYIRKLKLRCTPAQEELLAGRRDAAAKRLKDSPLKGKYLTRRINDNTFINFADFILADPENAAYNIPRIRASLAILKDGQAVFSNLEKVYLYRYVFTKGQPAEDSVDLTSYTTVPDREIAEALRQMQADRKNPYYANFSLLQDKLLWIARGCQKRGITYMEISDTGLVKPDQAPALLGQIHVSMPAINRETGIVLRFLASFRRIPLTIVRDQVEPQRMVQDQVRTLRAIACDPYVAGSDIIGEEINDIRDLQPLIRELVSIAGAHPGFVIRIHAGENDSLRNNVAESLRCVKASLAPGQPMPPMRIGHGLYTANLRSRRGKQLIDDLRESDTVLEFQLTSNVRLNNLSVLDRHPLKQYLSYGISCVQGTDGGAIYGTDSIDEQLALERMLDLTYDDMLAMRKAEDRVLAASMETYYLKQASFAKLCGSFDPEAFLADRIRNEPVPDKALMIGRGRLESLETLGDQVREMPTDKVPVILLGGSFNTDRRKTRMQDWAVDLLRRIVGNADPDKVFFVIGHRMLAYEKELVRMCGNRFEIFAMVPTHLTAEEAARLKKSGVGIRISIEPVGMGLYKSFSYEIFKRRPSVVVALDGNSAGTNVIQEARNGKRKARIFINRHATSLYSKAKTLRGYTAVIENADAAEQILGAVVSVWDEIQ